MDAKIIVILILIGFIIWTYNDPDKSKDLIDNGISKTKSLVNLDNKECGEEYVPVCGTDGISYTNACWANLAGISEYTVGVCKDGNS